jgi:predicted CxxxxCH...CXXCH cytochrome family protein
MGCLKLFPVAVLCALLTTRCGDVGTNDDTSGPGADAVGSVGDIAAEPPDPNCIVCHGSAVSAAPPKSTAGDMDTTKRGVGAHAMHVVSTTLARPIACTSCHVVPVTIGDDGHMDSPRPAEITFGGLALTDGATPKLMGATDPFVEGASLSCAGTYCHGATLSGGVQHQPIWTQVDGTQKTCDSCHGAPPPPPHMQSNACELCHAETAGPNLTIAHPEKHVNGMIEVSAQSCSACHGSATNAAPPKSTLGQTDTTAVGVGAHQAHLGATLATPLACAECHTVPTEVGAAGHMDSALPAELTFGARAASDGATPSWDHASTSCTTYCHGQTLGGGATTNPVWTKVDGSQKSCGSCHGAPPPAPHTSNTACETCHTETAGPNMTILHPDKHVNGIVEVSGLSCSACHGSAGSNAPPKDTVGNTATTFIGVGAHQQHLGTTLTTPVACVDCHMVPGTVGAAGHTDTALPAELTFGQRAAYDGASPSWDHGAASCTTYCHGQTITGGSTKTPVWTKVDGTQKTCASCHGAPPPPPHTTSTACESCHTETAGPNMTIAHPDKHLNGVVEVSGLSCNSCHGSAGSNAPPTDTVGNTATTFMGVGAHQKHLGATISAPIACTQCHTVPDTIGAAGHKDTPLPAELTFGALASSAGAVPSWNHTAATCATYCHGATLGGGGTNKAPKWTKVDGTQAACGTCHGVSPTTARHPSVFEDHMWMGKNCTHCHGGETNTTGTAILNPAVHVNGTKNVTLQAGGSYNAATKKCSPTCHETETWK